MTEEIQDQISAFVDDELSLDECMFLVRRFERDPQARRRVASYLTIGAALRGELVHPDPAALRQRLDKAMGGSAPSIVPAAAARSFAARGLVKPAVGVAIAASVAIAAVLVLRSGAMAPGGAVVATEVPGPLTAASVEPRSYVVPQEASESRAVTQPIRLTNYLVHHGEFASGLGRTLIHSSIVSAQETLTETEEQQNEPVEQ
jgi:negative regulator of sigma E activity